MSALVIATGNRGKAAEFAALLEPRGIAVLTLADIPGMPPIDENGATFLDNALIKARETCSFTGKPALADDSGLAVDALDGAPGVHSARFAPTTEERNARLLDMMRDVPDDSRTARFVCALVLVRPDGFEWTTVGVCEGTITRQPSGADGFGYDPVFFYPPLGATFAELSRDEKNTVSHRGRAIRDFMNAVDRNGILA